MSTSKLAVFTKPSPDGSAWVETVRRLDEAFERRWSFRVVFGEIAGAAALNALVQGARL